MTKINKNIDILRYCIQIMTIFIVNMKADSSHCITDFSKLNGKKNAAQF